MRWKFPMRLFQERRRTKFKAYQVNEMHISSRPIIRLLSLSLFSSSFPLMVKLLLTTLAASDDQDSLVKRSLPCLLQTPDFPSRLLFPSNLHSFRVNESQAFQKGIRNRV